MDKGNFPVEPILKLPIFLTRLNLRFNAPLLVTDNQHILLDNLWASRVNPKNLVSVIHTLSTYFHNRNKSTSQIPTSSNITSQVLKPHTVEYFIEQDKKIKFLKTEVRNLKGKEEKLERELQEKLREIDDLRNFI